MRIVIGLILITILFLISKNPTHGPEYRFNEEGAVIDYIPHD